MAASQLLKPSPESCTEPLHPPPELVVTLRLWTALEKVTVKLSVRGTLEDLPLAVLTLFTASFVFASVVMKSVSSSGAELSQADSAIHAANRTRTSRQKV